MTFPYLTESDLMTGYGLTPGLLARLRKGGPDHADADTEHPGQGTLPFRRQGEVPGERPVECLPGDAQGASDGGDVCVGGQQVAQGLRRHG